MRQFRETASPDLQTAGDPALHYASYNWARPYIYLVPDQCLVLDDGNGRVVGYLLGVPNTEKFVADVQNIYLPYLESQGMTPPRVENQTKEQQADKALEMQRITWSPSYMLQSTNPNLIRKYPAHLHIDILSAYQGQGWGRRMIEEISRKFRGMHVRGIHLGKHGANFGAGEFYIKLGFHRFEEVMDGGKSGETGRTKDGGVYMAMGFELE